MCAGTNNLLEGMKMQFPTLLLVLCNANKPSRRLLEEAIALLGGCLCMRNHIQALHLLYLLNFDQVRPDSLDELFELMEEEDCVDLLSELKQQVRRGCSGCEWKALESESDSICP